MKKIKNIIIKVVSLILLNMLVINVNTVNANNKEIESGTYEIKNDIKHESELGVSMARSYTDETMELLHTKDKKEYIVTFTGTEYMKNYRLLVNDKEVNAETKEENKEKNSIKLSFPITSIEDKVEAKIYVDAMGRDVQFGIVPKQDTLKLINKIEEKKEVVSSSKENESKLNSKTENKESKKSLPISSITIGVSLVGIIAIGLLITRKTK